MLVEAAWKVTRRRARCAPSIERVRARRGRRSPPSRSRASSPCSFWHLLTPRRGLRLRPALADRARRSAASSCSPAPRAQKGRHGIAGGKSKAVFDAERELSPPGRARLPPAGQRLAGQRTARAGAGATPGRASHRPSKGKAARQTPSPNVCASLVSHPHPTERIPPAAATVHLTFIRRTSAVCTGSRSAASPSECRREGRREFCAFSAASSTSQ